MEDFNQFICVNICKFTEFGQKWPKINLFGVANKRT